MQYSVDHILESIFDSNESNQWSPSEKIPLVAKEIEKYKLDIREFISQGNYNIQDLTHECKDLCIESENFIEDMLHCKKEIEGKTMAEIVKSIENYNLLSQELQTINYTYSIIANIMQCNRYLQDYQDSKEFGQFLRAAEVLDDLSTYLNIPIVPHRELKIHTSFKQALVELRNDFTDWINKKWDSYLSWSCEDTNRKTTVYINIHFTRDQAIPAFLDALTLCKMLDEKVNDFATFLLNQVLKPLVYQDCTVQGESDEKIVITISQRTPTKPEYGKVLENLKLVLLLLSSRLNLNTFSNGKTVLSAVGELISKEFGEILIKECLVETIPNKVEDLQSYSSITSVIQELQSLMVDINFIPEHFSILTYTDNIDILFADKSSHYFLSQAREIMFKDLSVTMSIGVESIPDEKGKMETEEATIEEALKVFDSTIPKGLFYFPRCMISKSAQELLDLVYMMMEQGLQCSDLVCKRSYATTRLVFELYDAVVPYYHENFLQTIPQYAALFHNNCMFLAHNLQLLGEKWTTLMFERQISYPLSFLDLVQRLRELAYKHLTIHMQLQRKQILDNIRASDLNRMVVRDILGDNAELAVRQCLRQLQLLKNVWIGVFPPNVFARLMATLVNMFVEELIHKVCTVEDISSEMAGQLTEMYALVAKKAPNHFQKSTDIEMHVKSWVKLQELILILGGSLKDIEKRWGDGTGPIAVNFKPDEVRTLIKALFQNTQMRSNLLAKIK